MRAWIEPLGWMLVHSVWLISLIVAVTAVVLSVLRRRSANARYLVGCVALVLSVSVLPSVFAWVMAQPHEVPQPVVVGDKVIDVNTADAIAWDGAGQSFRIDADPDFASQPVMPERQRITGNEPRTKPAERARLDESTTQSAVDEPTTWQRIEARLRPYLAWMVSGWLAGVCLLSLRPLIGWHATWRLRRVGLSEVPDSVSATLNRLADRLGLQRATTIFQSSLVRIPCVVGAFKPVILLPASVLVGLSPEQLEALLAHELAHIRRHDFAVNVVQTMAETLLFYHPAIWWLSRRIRQEREHCCDDLAISVCGDVAGYARMLVSIEGLRARMPQTSVAAGGGSLVERIRRLLPSPEQTRSPWITGIVMLATLMVLVGSWQWTVGQVSNLPRNEIAADQADAERTDQEVKGRDSKAAKADGQVGNLPHEDVFGKIEKPDGSPAAKATVIAVRFRPFATSDLRHVVTTNERGEFTLRLSGIGGADASWLLSAFLGNDGGKLDDSIVVPKGGSEDGADAKSNPKNSIIRLKPGRLVSGTVLDATTQKSIADAKVYSRDGQIASTDARGHFLFRGLPADIAEFIVTSPGLLRTRMDVDVSERTEADVEIALARGGTVRGRVIDPQGRPVANAAVSRITGNAILSAAMTEITDADGRFTFDGFPVNKLIYPFSVSAVGFCCTDAELVALNGFGDTKEITLRISKMDSDGIRLLNDLAGDNTPPTGTIRGRAIYRGKPVRNFTVRLLSPTLSEPRDTGSFGASFRRFTTDDGRFVIGRLDADKRYRVAVTTDDEACAIVEPIYARVASALTDKDEVDFPLRPPHQLRVRVLDADTKQPIPNVRVGLKADEPAREEFEWNLRLSGSRTEWTSRGGTALFNNLSAESGPIFVEHPGYARQQTFWKRPPDAESDSGKTSEPDEIVLTLRKEARLRIRVGGLDGRDFKNIYVLLKSSTKESFNSDGALNPAPQTLELRTLPPGPLSMTIHDAASDEPWTSLVTRKVELKPGDNELEVELPPAPKKVSAVGDDDTLGAGLSTPPDKPTAGLPNSDKETKTANDANGDLRSKPAAGSGDPRRAQAVYQFAGTVVDARGDAVAGALVLYPVSFDQTAWKWRTAKAQTNQRGEFVLSVPKSWFRVVGFAQNVVWAWAKDHACDTVSLGDPEKVQAPLRLTLAERQPCEFTVHDEHGQPVEKAEVVPLSMDVPNGSDPVGGRYGLADWVPEELQSATAQVTDARGRVVLDLAARERFDMLQVTTTAHGQQRFRQQDNVLRLRPATSITGRLVGAPDSIVSGVRLAFTMHEQSGPGTVLEVVTDREGRFSVPKMPVGAYRGSGQLPEPWLFLNQSELQIAGRKPGEVRVEIGRGIPAKGKVVVKGTNQPIADARVSISSGAHGRTNSALLVTNERGEFSTFVLPGQSCSIQLISFPEAPLVLHPPSTKIEIAADATDFKFNDIACEPARKLTGKLIDENDRPIESKYVGPRDGQDHRERTNAAGEFTLLLAKPAKPDAWEVLWSWLPEEKTVPAEIVSETPLVIRVNREKAQAAPNDDDAAEASAGRE